jgi:hypothetical protein
LESSINFSYSFPPVAMLIDYLPNIIRNMDILSDNSVMEMNLINFSPDIPRIPDVMSDYDPREIQ